MLGMNIYFGALLAELSNRLPSPPYMTPQRNPYLRTMVGVTLLLGLHVSGYPEVSPEWTAWSQSLAQIGQFIFPGNYWRYWTSIGAQLITLAVVISPQIQEILSHPSLVWLGSVSLPLYLIHGPLVRSLLMWMLLGWKSPVSRTSFPNGWVFCIVLPIFFLLLLWASQLWTTWVEPWCASMTKRLEEIMYGADRGERGDLSRTHGDRSRNGGVLNQV